MATRETLGILPVPGDIRDSSGMAPFVDITNRAQKPPKHRFLAKMQGTRKAILPIHTAAEKSLFRTLMESNRYFNPADGSLPNWNEAVRVWNAWADKTEDVWYKLNDQLKFYHSQWVKNSDIKEALSLSSEVRKPLTRIIHDSQRSVAAPAVPFQTLNQHVAGKGFLERCDTPLPGQPSSSHYTTNNPVPSALPLSFPNTQPSSQTQYGFVSAPYPPASCQSSTTRPFSNSPSHAQPVVSMPPQNLESTSVASSVARKRVADALAAQGPPTKKARKPRTCTKCAQPECPGKQRVSNCRNPCRDCGRVQCRGRNSKRLNEPCHLRDD
ncbi:hypothetical protein M413DRAFT_20280 [Hebeloma cylindrosporum]|uniref:Uncharacterized protein n=1 Tax=Hebeloma cylindrosporum TaxID=76867 RepID=A0A0C2Y9F7_HEBCY|nr:hypothetical protein M413DRAFT_20280 [Hebeloma cylindrosporum h7]